MDLRQGKITVLEYIAKFEELARFSTSITPTDEARKIKYMLRLRIYIARQIDSIKERSESYADAVQRALRFESWNKRKEGSASGREERPAALSGTRVNFKRRFSSSSGGQSSWNRYQNRRPFPSNPIKPRPEKRSFQGNQTMNQTRVSRQALPQRNAPLPITTRGQRTPTTPCPKCKMIHQGECLFNFTQVYYSSGQEGHIAKFLRELPRSRLRLPLTCAPTPVFTA